MKIRLIYRLRGREKLKVGLFQAISRPGEEVEIISRGVLAEAAEVEITATIKFERGAKGAKGRIDLDATVSGGEARAVQKPVMVCDEEAVSGQHKAVSGRLDPETVKYLCSRGYRPQKAREGLLEAKLKEGYGVF